MSADRAKALGLAPVARFVPTRRRASSPSGSASARCGHAQGPRVAGLTLDDIDLVELNEAFAVQ